MMGDWVYFENALGTEAVVKLVIFKPRLLGPLVVPVEFEVLKFA